MWVVTKTKSRNRKGKVQLIDASKCCEARRKSIGNKRVDISETARDLIVKAYRDFKTRSYRAESGIGELLCKSHIFVNSAFGYTKIVVESPLLEGGRKVEKKGRVVAVYFQARFGKDSNCDGKWEYFCRGGMMRKTPSSEILEGVFFYS